MYRLVHLPGSLSGPAGLVVPVLPVLPVLTVLTVLTAPARRAEGGNSGNSGSSSSSSSSSRVLTYTRSTISAMPWPTPMHMVHSA